MTMYAITEASYRAVASADDLQAGEQLVDEIPVALLGYLAGVEVRNRRNAMLRESDWTVSELPDSPLTAEHVSAWRAYRQALRDLPSHPLFPHMPWPTPPLTGGESADLG